LRASFAGMTLHLEARPPPPSLRNEFSSTAASAQDTSNAQELRRRFVKDALEKKVKGTSYLYDRLVIELEAAKKNHAAFGPLLTALADSASDIIAVHHGRLALGLFSFGWALQDNDIHRPFSKLLMHLVSRNLVYQQPCAEMLAKALFPREEDWEAVHVNDSSMERVHDLIKDMLRVFPSMGNIFFKKVQEFFPHKREEADVQKRCLSNILQLASYAPTFRDQIFEFVMEKLIQIDVDIKLDDVPDEDQIFEMERVPTESTFTRMMADKLDGMMIVLFEFFGRVFTEGSLSRDEVLSELLRAFNIFLLHTYKSKYIQFLLFYICSFNPEEYPERFVHQCLYSHLFQASPTTFPITRITSASYLGSFISRARYVPARLIKDSLYRMASWAHAYLDRHAQRPPRPSDSDVEVHGVFYAVCQSIFYVFCYKHEKVMELQPPDPLRAAEAAAERKAWLRSLNLQRIIDCSLNPFKVCQPAVVKEFSRLAHHYDLAHCHHVLVRNVTMVLQSRSLLGGENRLDAFFPFDPYLLKRSASFINPLYQAWRASGYSSESATGSDSDSDSDSDPEEDDAPSDGGEDEQDDDGVRDVVGRRTDHERRHVRVRSQDDDDEDGLDGLEHEHVSRSLTITVTPSRDVDGSHAGFPRPASVSDIASGSECGDPMDLAMSPSPGTPWMLLRR